MSARELDLRILISWQLSVFESTTEVFAVFRQFWCKHCVEISITVSRKCVSVPSFQKAPLTLYVAHAGAIVFFATLNNWKCTKFANCTHIVTWSSLVKTLLPRVNGWRRKLRNNSKWIQKLVFANFPQFRYYSFKQNSVNIRLSSAFLLIC